MKNLLVSIFGLLLIISCNYCSAQEKMKTKDDKTKMKDSDANYKEKDKDNKTKIKDEESKMKTKSMDAGMSQPPAEFADPKYSEIVKKSNDALSRGDVDGYLAAYADNAVHIWNNGDSVAGKTAITGYWKKRRMEVLDSLTFSNSIFLPLKVNKPQSVEAPGIWVLSWYLVNAKYKTGKRMTQWMHTDVHFDTSDKIDRVIMYLDRAPINEAMKQ